MAKVQTSLLFSVIDKLYGRLQDLLSLRYDWTSCRSLIYLQEYSGSEPGMEEEHQNLIQFVAHQAIGLSSYLLDPVKFKEGVCS